MSAVPSESTGDFPAPLSPYSESDQLAARRAAPGIMGAMITTVLLTSCTGSPENTDPSATPSTSAAIPLGPIEAFDTPYGACNSSIGAIAGKDSPQFAAAARECLDLYGGAEIALVNYDLAADDAQTMASQLDRRIESATEGNVMVTVTVVQPSGDAKQLFRTENSDNCVDSTDLWRYGSYIASAVMPDLVQYDSVIGVSNMKSCDGSAVGVASSMYGRYAEVFGAADGWQAIENNGGSNYKSTDLGNGVSQIENFQNPADIAAHEQLHVWGLGHAGKLYNGSDLGGRALRGSQTEAYVDLDAYVAGGTFTEYGDASSVMGDVGGLKENAPLTTVQQYLMAWPELALNEVPPVTVHDLSRQEVTYNSDSARDSVAVLSLPNPLSMPTGEYSSSTDFGKSQKFDTIAFVPQFEVNSGGAAWGTEVYLTSQDNSSASLGLLYCPNDSGSGRYDLVVGGQKVTVTFSDAGVSLRVQQ